MVSDSRRGRQSTCFCHSCRYIALLTSLLTTVGARADDELTWPPRLPGGKEMITITGPGLLEPSAELAPGVKIARTPPKVEFMYYPGQNYPGNPWSVWGDGSAIGTKYYSAIGDHKSPEGNAFVFEYDSQTRQLDLVVDLRKTLRQPKGRYTPGKIHGRVDMGGDGWLYFSTHRGSTRIAQNPAAHFKGDWILRYHSEKRKTEIVAHAPLPMQCMPCSLLDPDRMIFYAGTADGLNERDPQFLAYDVTGRKILYSDSHGPYRYMIFARSTGRIYFRGQVEGASSRQGEGQLVRFDPAKPGKPVPIRAHCGLRAATTETADGFVYTVDRDGLWAFNTRTERATPLGPAAVASQTYTTSIDVDPVTGRYLYYIPGAHGGAQHDGTPVVQYDVKTQTRKVIAFLHPLLHERAGYVTLGTFGSAVSPEGDKIYVTWNGNRGTRKQDLGSRVSFNTCALTVIYIPQAERK